MDESFNRENCQEQKAVSLRWTREGKSKFVKFTTVNTLRLAMLVFALAHLARAEEINSSIAVEERQVSTNAQQKYFLIEHKGTNESAKGLILILPGGPGTKEFLPFCANVLTLYGIPEEFIVAELVAPEWRTDESRVVWPSVSFPDSLAKFTSEEFIAAVIKDVSDRRKIDERFIFTFGWSSSGHVLYSASLSNDKVRGSIVAMSRFLPERLGDLERARGKSYFLYHSPADQICPFREAQFAEQTLKSHGANVKLTSYPGGHGWVPNTYYCDRIKEGIEWLKQMNANTNSALTRAVK
jgi:predicted esterase